MKQRKHFSILTAAVMCLSLLSGQTAMQVAAAETVAGDVNDDGAVTVIDLIVLQIHSCKR